MGDQESIRDELALVVQNETGEADEESQFVADAILASPVIRRIQAEAVRRAAQVAYDDVMRWFLTETLPEDDTSCSVDVRKAIRDLADRIEKGDVA